MAKHAKNPEALYDDEQGRRTVIDDAQPVSASANDPYAKTTSGFDNFAYKGAQDPALSGPLSYDDPDNERATFRYEAYTTQPLEDAYAPQQAGAHNAAPTQQMAGRQYASDSRHTSQPPVDYAGFDGGTPRNHGDFWADATPKRKKKHSGLKKFLIALLVILVVISAAFALYVHEFDSRIQANQSTPAEMANVLTPPTPGEPYYMLLLGSDWRENSGTSKRADQSGDNERADVIILTRVDEANSQVTLVTVPRDSRWEHDGTVSKINEAYNIGGAALMTQAVSELTNTPISYTAEIHFSGLMNMVDALGGVEVDVPQSVYFWDALTGEGIEVQAGKQRLNGQEAQVFARVRHDYAEQEGQRQSNVRTLVLAIANEIRAKNPAEWPFLMLDIADCFGSDLRFFDFARLMMNFVGKDITMYSVTGPNKGDIDAGTGLWLCYPNPDGWARLMEAVNAGDDPSGVDVNAGYENQGTVNTELLEGESVYMDEAADVQWDQAIGYDTWVPEAETQVEAQPEVSVDQQANGDESANDPEEAASISSTQQEEQGDAHQDDAEGASMSEGADNTPDNEVDNAADMEDAA